MTRLPMTTCGRRLNRGKEKVMMYDSTQLCYASHGAGSGNSFTQSRRMNVQAGGQRKLDLWMPWAAEIGSLS
jgi:hypothetical protein